MTKQSMSSGLSIFGVKEAGFFQNPVVVLVFGSRSSIRSMFLEEPNRDSEVLLDVADGRVGGERTVGDVNHVPLAHFFLHAGRKDVC